MGFKKFRRVGVSCVSGACGVGCVVGALCGPVLRCGGVGGCEYRSGAVRALEGLWGALVGVCPYRIRRVWGVCCDAVRQGGVSWCGCRRVRVALEALSGRLVRFCGLRAP